LAVVAVVTTACVTAVDVVAAAVIGAADVKQMGCSESLHCAIQHV